MKSDALSSLGPVIRALWFLQSRSLANNLKARLKRLKQPKYLIGAVVGLGYFGAMFMPSLIGFFSHSWHSGASHSSVRQGLQAAREGLSLALMGWVLLNWILPTSRAALHFSEAELAFLLPAPIGRRTLIQYRLLRTVFPILFTSFIFSFFSGMVGRQPWIIRILGWWMVMMMLHLHAVAASFTMTRLMDSGLTARWRRIAIMAVVLLLGGGCVIAIARALPDFPRDPTDFFMAPARWLHDAVSVAPLRWILYPFELITGPRFSRDYLEFAQRLPGALLVLAAHYIWVIQTEVSFEEASIELAQRRAAVVASMRQGKHPLTLGKRKKIRAPFQLSPTGFPPIALLWKNLIAAGSGYSPKVLFLIGLWFCFTGGSAVLALNASGHGGFAVSVVALSLFAFALVLLMGPQMVRYDFRHDLQSIDLVKLYPLPGWQVVLGEILAPAVILTCVEWILLFVAGLFSHGIHFENFGMDDSFTALNRWSLCLAAALIVPGFNLAALIVPNGLTLIFPAWVQIGKEGPVGFEVMGQRMVMSLGALFALVVALFPACVVFAILFFAAKWLIGLYVGILLGAVGALAMLLGEAALGISLLGKSFEKLDLT